jgi:hypothetical protein
MHHASRRILTQEAGNLVCHVPQADNGMWIKGGRDDAGLRKPERILGQQEAGRTSD